MKKILAFLLALTICPIAHAGLLDVFNAVNTKTDENSTYVDKKAAEIKTKIEDKIASKYLNKSTDEQESMLESLKEKLAELKESGEEKTTQYANIQAEIESLKKLIEAAKK